MQLSFDLLTARTSRLGAEVSSPVHYTPHRSIVELGRFAGEPLRP